jgi:hypothetical protein
LDESHADAGLLKFPEIVPDDSGTADVRMNDPFESDDDAEEPAYIPLPSSLTALHKELLGDYTCPTNHPSSGCKPHELTPCQELSLRHYVAWKKSNGTVKAFELHGDVLQKATGHNILSLYKCRQLVIKLTGLKAHKVDICPDSCIAYTGPFQDMRACPYVRDGKTCGKSRYSPPRVQSSNMKDKPLAQMLHLPVMATIRAMFANETSSNLLRHRDRCLQEALHVTAEATRKYSDFGDSRVHMQHYKRGLFNDARDIAFAMSTDGAQLTMKKQSDTWLLILILLNLPAEIRYKFSNIIVAFATPGPKPPGNMESYIYLIFQEMAKASEGIWTWDAVESSYFVNRAYVCMALGDMLGSAKLNGMAGHAAIYGDRFSMVKGARSSQKRGAKAQYYPIVPPCNAVYNHDRPTSYNLDQLPIRQEKDYWTIIERIQAASTKAAKAAITKETGVSRLPLCAASRTFSHPTFFPLDPFHLFYENIVSFIWDIWMSHSLPGETRIHVPEQKRKKFGELVAEAMSTLPSSFCGLVRDPNLKRQSQYKVYEWMALVHWYIIPIGLELGLDSTVLKNYSLLVEAIEFAMTIKPRQGDEIRRLHDTVKNFLMGFERLYVGNDPEKISRVRLCVFQLIHVARHIEWNGSIRVGSQATVERAIGSMGHQIRSKKAPFAHLANIIYDRELLKTLLLCYPSLNSPEKPLKEKILMQAIRISKAERKPDQELYKHIEAICLWLRCKFNCDLDIHRYGKICLPGGTTLRSRLSENRGKPPTRSSRYFEGKKQAGSFFGEALAFFKLVQNSQLVMVYQPLVNIQHMLTAVRGNWSGKIEVLPVSALSSLIGILCFSEKVYVLRKHPALFWLTDEEKGVVYGEGLDDDDDDDDDGADGAD